MMSMDRGIEDTGRWFACVINPLVFVMLLPEIRWVLCPTDQHEQKSLNWSVSRKCKVNLEKLGHLLINDFGSANSPDQGRLAMIIRGNLETCSGSRYFANSDSTMDPSKIRPQLLCCLTQAPLAQHPTLQTDTFWSYAAKDSDVPGFLEDVKSVLSPTYYSFIALFYNFKVKGYGTEAHSTWKNRRSEWLFYATWGEAISQDLVSELVREIVPQPLGDIFSYKVWVVGSLSPTYTYSDCQSIWSPPCVRLRSSPSSFVEW